MRKEKVKSQLLSCTSLCCSSKSDTRQAAASRIQRRPPKAHPSPQICGPLVLPSRYQSIVSQSVSQSTLSFSSMLSPFWVGVLFSVLLLSDSIVGAVVGVSIPVFSMHFGVDISRQYISAPYFLMCQLMTTSGKAQRSCSRFGREQLSCAVPIFVSASRDGQQVGLASVLGSHQLQKFLITKNVGSHIISLLKKGGDQVVFPEDAFSVIFVHIFAYQAQRPEHQRCSGNRRLEPSTPPPPHPFCGSRANVERHKSSSPFAFLILEYKHIYINFIECCSCTRVQENEQVSVFTCFDLSTNRVQAALTQLTVQATMNFAVG